LEWSFSQKSSIFPYIGNKGFIGWFTQSTEASKKITRRCLNSGGGEKSHIRDCVMARSYIPSEISELVSIWRFEDADGKLEIIIISRFQGSK
jgi:hypothetical protein